MNRQDLIEAGALAIHQLWPHRHLIYTPFAGDVLHTESAAVIDAIEPMIRKDERERLLDHLDIRREALADLRAKIEVLPGNDPFQSPERRDAYEYAIDQVLNLIDGGTDD